MQLDFLRDNNSDKLIFLALGWGADPSVVEHLTENLSQDYDIACTYDYKTIERVNLPSRYTQVYLIAWSFAVWAAEQMFSPEQTFTRALAFAGSPYPVSEQYGIAPKRLRISIAGFKKQGIEKFDMAVYEKKMNLRRNQEDRIEELEALEAQAIKPYTPHIKWDKAYISERDTIFPCENLQSFWAIDTKILPLPHFPFGDYKLIEQELGIR